MKKYLQRYFYVHIIQKKSYSFRVLGIINYNLSSSDAIETCYIPGFVRSALAEVLSLLDSLADF